MNRFSLPVAATVIACSAASAHAQQAVIGTEMFQISVGTGYSFIRADELVFDNGNRISHLIWESQAPTVTANARLDFAAGWTLKAKANLAGFGTSHMKDYDWDGPFVIGYDFDDWTHRSIHDDTRLHHYFTGDITLGRDFSLRHATVNLHAGLKYTDVSWTAMDGDFIYSWTGYRENTGTGIPGLRSISYQQRIPGLFAGVDIEATHGNWTFEGQVRGGVSVSASATDHHWKRLLRFEDAYKPAPFATVAARVSYQATTSASVFLGADYEHHFEALGNTSKHDLATGVETDYYKNGSGGALRALTVSAGLKVAF